MGHSVARQAERIAEQARLAAADENWDTCAELCRQGVALGDDVPLDSWVAVRLGLAAAAVNLLGGESGIVDEAIGEVRRVVIRDDLRLDDVRRGSAFRYLGGLFEARTTGSRRANLVNVIEYYQRAATVFRRDSFPEDWALLRICTAIALRDQVQSIGLPNLRASSAEHAKAERNLRFAVAASSDALSVYRDNTDVDNAEEATELIRSIEAMLEQLHDYPV